jgi:AcrR family transcriptional regulator
MYRLRMSDGVAHRRAPHQLPAGRHGLPRAFVVSNQRERILDGVMHAASRSGYGDLRVEDIIAYAGVSRRTFYDHFANKEEAFLAAYDLVVEQLEAAVAAAHATGPSWPASIRRALAAFLNLLAAEPVLAHVCVVDVLAAGPRALERRAAALRRFERFLQPRDGSAPGAASPTPLTVEAVVGGLYEVVYARVVDGRAAELPALMPSLLYSVLLPFAGEHVAAAEYRRASATAAERASAAESRFERVRPAPGDDRALGSG